jgi:hypothetical protein
MFIKMTLTPGLEQRLKTALVKYPHLRKEAAYYALLNVGVETVNRSGVDLIAYVQGGLRDE